MCSRSCTVTNGIRRPTRRGLIATPGSWRCSTRLSGGQMPVLAICRGLQLVNVARGGSLQQHLPESLGTDRYKLGGGVFAENEVTVSTGTRLAGILGDGGLRVHSYHHQGVDRLGDGLVVSARTDDGLVQAVEDSANGYLVGVQWHPEENAENRRLFEDLVAQAREFAHSEKEAR
ncbi:gamma-glutamyl-gamma-aminobutyrate hydrolase family protein [Microbacterium sp. AGC85]